MINSFYSYLLSPFTFAASMAMIKRGLLILCFTLLTSLVFSQEVKVGKNQPLKHSYLLKNQSFESNLLSSHSLLHLNSVNNLLLYSIDGALVSTVKNDRFTSAMRIDSTDTDGDGIVDSLDKCPEEKGVIEYDGCPMPDSDNDGIADDLDECPTIAGLIKNKGCPPGDKDGDKINDDADKCPDDPGVARYDGCPVKDTDGDGVDDENDNCIKITGTLINAGCPEDKASPSTKKEKRKKRASESN